MKNYGGFSLIPLNVSFYKSIGKQCHNFYLVIVIFQYFSIANCVVVHIFINVDIHFHIVNAMICSYQRNVIVFVLVHFYYRHFTQYLSWLYFISVVVFVELLSHHLFSRDEQTSSKSTLDQ